MDEDLKLSDESILSAEPGSAITKEGNPPEDAVILLMSKSELDYEVIITRVELERMLESL